MPLPSLSRESFPAVLLCLSVLLFTDLAALGIVPVDAQHGPDQLLLIEKVLRFRPGKTPLVISLGLGVLDPVWPKETCIQPTLHTATSCRHSRVS